MSAVPIPALAHCANCETAREVNRFGACVVCGSESIDHTGPDALELARRRREQEAAGAERERFLRKGAECACGGCRGVGPKRDDRG